MSEKRMKGASWHVAQLALYHATAYRKLRKMLQEPDLDLCCRACKGLGASVVLMAINRRWPGLLSTTFPGNSRFSPVPKGELQNLHYTSKGLDVLPLHQVRVEPEPIFWQTQALRHLGYRERSQNGRREHDSN